MGIGLGCVLLLNTVSSGLSRALDAPPNSAAPIVLSHVLPGMPGAATQEFIALFNQTEQSIDVTGWCITQKTNKIIACLGSDTLAPIMMVPAYGFVTLASSQFASMHPDMQFGAVFEPLSQSSGSIVGSSDHLRLLDATGSIVDAHDWTASPPSGASYVRTEQLIEYDTGMVQPYFLDTDSSSDWISRILDTYPFDTSERHEGPRDACSNVDGIQEFLPVDMYYDEFGNCVPMSGALPTVVISELLPNPAGADEDGEWIELWNYGAEPVSLEGLVVRYNIRTVKELTLSQPIMLDPNSYYVVQSPDYTLSLTNTASSASLYSSDSSLLSETAPYENAPDGTSWAWFETGWEFTNRPTPGVANKANALEEMPVLPITSSLKPCRPDQYRSTETNRCRLIPKASVASACQPGWYRNPETGRCRKIAVAPTLKPCAEGQVRNPETNRCRTNKQMTEVDYGVLAAVDTNEPSQGYILLILALLAAGILGYGIWEWRREVRQFLASLWRRLVHRTR